MIAWCGDAGTAMSKAHVLAVPYAGLVGHVNPLMSLCQQLAAEGDVAVTFAYSQSYFDRSQALLCQTTNAVPQDGAQYSHHDNIRTVGVQDGLAYQEYLTPDTPRLHSQSGIDMEDKLVELAHMTNAQHPTPITCIIADVFVVCAASAARRLGIPYVAFWTQSAASFAAHIVATKDYATLKGKYGYGAAAAEAATGKAGAGVEDKVMMMRMNKCMIPGCPALRLNELPTFLQALDPDEYFFAYLTKCFASVEENCSHVLINSFEELEPEAMQFINKKKNNISAVGPLLPKEYLHVAQDEGKLSSSSWAAAAPADDKSLTWLDTHKPKSVLFVSFGSLALLSQAQLEELAYGLEASQCPFLMVVRTSLMDGHSPLFPTGFQDRMLHSGLALFVSWAPQLQVLAHPSVGGFLTHSGWNSTLEGISRGLPFLCWPYFVDQMMNSRCIVDAWRIGLNFEEEESESTSGFGSIDNVPLVSRHLIKERIKSLMDPSASASLRERSHHFHLTASKAVLHDHGSSHLKLKSFIEWLQKSGMSRTP